MANSERRVAHMVALALGVMILAGCATTGTVGSSSVARTQPVAPLPSEETRFTAPVPLGPVSAPGEVAEPVPGGVVDWSGGTVRARGTGVMDPGNMNKAQARLMAERAAVVVAQRNLLEIVNGVRVDSDTRVQNFMTDYDVVYTHVEGIVKGARQVGPARYDSVAGTVEVELEMPMYGDSSLEQALAPVLGPKGEVAAAGLSPRVREFFEQYGGLVMDAGNSGLKPALFPKIYDEDGNLLLDTKDCLKYAGRSGQAAVQFIRALDEVLANKKLGNQPLVLKVKQVRGKLGADIVISRVDADKLKWLKDGARYLFDAGRFIVKLML
ncbi:MAG: hypothetical protein ABIK86_00940 [candidate division WOR-3 bacterium]